MSTFPFKGKKKQKLKSFHETIGDEGMNQSVKTTIIIFNHSMKKNDENENFNNLLISFFNQMVNRVKIKTLYKCQ